MNKTKHVQRVVEDYKPLDIQAAAMTLALCGGIREHYPEWKYLINGGGSTRTYAPVVFHGFDIFKPFLLPNIIEIAEAIPFETVLVESHPKLVNDRCIDFQNLLKPQLQIAMGLETVHPGVFRNCTK
jgi:hypothetical protein